MSIVESTKTNRIEKRILVTEENGLEIEREFRVNTVNSHEDFIPANKHANVYSLKTLGQNKVIEIPIRGISYGEWEEIENKLHVTELSEESTEQEKEKQKIEKEKNVGLRRVKVFELATDKNVPGETDEDKVTWLSENISAAELDALFNCIIERGSNINDGIALNEYNSALRNSKPVVSTFSGFDDWVSASNLGSIFRMQRPFEDFIIEVNLRQVTDSRKKQIDEQSKAPPPPSRPKIDKSTGRQIGMLYDYNNPNYKAQTKIANRKSLVNIFEACLPFSLPGDSVDKKYKWISELLLGDVIKLRNFIENEVFNYRNRIDFF